LPISAFLGQLRVKLNGNKLSDKHIVKPEGETSLGVSDVQANEAMDDKIKLVSFFPFQRP